MMHIFPDAAPAWVDAYSHRLMRHNPASCRILRLLPLLRLLLAAKVSIILLSRVFVKNSRLLSVLGVCYFLVGSIGHIDRYGDPPNRF